MVGEITTPEHLSVKAYQEQAKHKTQLERTELQKEKPEFVESLCDQSFNNKEIPIYIGDYGLVNYGTGVVMAVQLMMREILSSRKDTISLLSNLSSLI